ncbi:hypothetical protein ACWA06_06180 [Serratia rhizosphaerae]|uniref:hypothetical protein n=1 Tax=unclassified Serratia (in: enterobacteria) TaxID=2647522 RepID=UPI000DA30C88|nr:MULTISPECIES: hypothetical protein [unclassified Serratia (in: enterobacteria)]MBU3893363.1 hypothetical protein [Serratia rubidaea]MCA4824076.1 hypothetical protein [Serratia rubidaea]QNK33078.1 hypothetical protein HF675_03145 [Serratia sp. JUb9]QPT13362.1 hypothetical protein I6G37_23465 [Serratia rubidaea]CAE1150253.1 conserved membrane protein of unknown function [Serratia sp. Tan611]
MNKSTKAALVWGGLCAILLYRTLPAGVMMSWQVFRQYDIPVMQLVVSVLMPLLPALAPLGCFLALRTTAAERWLAVVILPMVAWLASHVILIVLFYFIAVKSGNVPPYSEGLSAMMLRMLNIGWLSSMLVVALTIAACGYAFWRESRR